MWSNGDLSGNALPYPDALELQRVYPLILGFTGVVDHSQRDIDGDKSMLDALESEAEFSKHIRSIGTPRSRTAQSTLPRRSARSILFLMHARVYERRF